MDRGLTLSVLDGSFCVCHLDRDATVPAGILRLEFFSVTRTRDELSIVALEGALRPAELPAGSEIESGWACLKVQGPLDFSLVGVLARLSGTLAEAGVPLFAISTYETDYLLVGNGDLERAMVALSEAGHVVGYSGS